MLNWTGVKLLQCNAQDLEYTCCQTVRYESLQIKLIGSDQENKLLRENFSQTHKKRANAKHLCQVKTAHLVEVYEVVGTKLLHCNEPISIHTC